MMMMLMQHEIDNRTASLRAQLDDQTVPTSVAGLLVFTGPQNAKVVSYDPETNLGLVELPTTGLLRALRACRTGESAQLKRMESAEHVHIWITVSRRWVWPGGYVTLERCDVCGVLQATGS